MRIRLPLGLAGLALTLPVAAAVAEQPAAPVRPTHPARVVQLWQTGDARLGSTSADNSIFEEAVTGDRPLATSADHKAPRSDANVPAARSASGTDDEPVADDSSHTGTKVAVGAAGALGLFFFIDAVSGGDNSSSLTPVDNPPGGGGNGGNVNTPDGGGTGTVVDNSNPGGDNGGTVNPPTNPPTSILVDQPSTPETTTPEPVSMTLIGTGLVGLGGISLRRRRDS